MKKLIIIMLTFLMLFLLSGLIMTVFITRAERERAEDSLSIPVDINEVKQLITAGDTEGAVSALDEMVLENDTLYGSNEVSTRIALTAVWLVVAVSILITITLMLYIYFRILRPFEKLKNYATEVSKGNMDVPLEMDKENYFGDFTWAFDDMRKEIIKARRAEKNAVENNKTVIATLSHDIKTPISSIRAYSEAFEANMDTNAEKRQKYLTVMMQKCDEVTKLTDDLFLHAISEMNKLEVKNEDIELRSFMDKKVRELFVEEKGVKIDLSGLGEERYINADPKRLLQIFENLKSNSDKYAKTDIEIYTEVKDHEVRIHFRDFGPGILDEEIPFITGKFYRGKNAGDENGSGLGLYIVNELLHKMGGKLGIYNKNPGLDVVIML